ncbi:Ribosomal RNA adenine methylase transferase [Cordyceps fumosorosea ARSEF 2679]|uniref:rRNA adenine N(6)-methyltransferase n=1 Tax=Cordyceps fumosorosea (strain ARSEF 2679) TaxID=1081104 RepID=A0A167QNB1_CORFA|nr:Ribosomal RNA adenine methylase transferase [Cordyceps fumosorosea ARSEF 2679]OAA57794.1 Ribosomal RNA adenine methylase transferase [Cordyceps fumosorosea ARSEF 2679]
MARSHRLFNFEAPPKSRGELAAAGLESRARPFISTSQSVKGVASKARGRSPPVDWLAAETDLAQQLLSTGLWGSARSRASKNSPVDTRRVNIVSEELCSDIIKYIGHSLERHNGCDLLDLNPGAGLWSKALHEALQPRKHVLLDLDADFYRPFLSDLLSKKNVELIKKSGIIWEDLENVVASRFTEQTKVAPHAETPPSRNDTLLVTANLSMCPKRAYRGFDNVGTMVLYQFLSSIRQSSLLQQYGLVRFLIWTNDEDKHRILPRSILRRRRSAFEAELSCDWLHEVCGAAVDVHARMALRDEWLNVESCAGAMARMEALGIEMPAHRQTETYKRIRESPELLTARNLADTETPQLARPYIEELDRLRHTVGLDSPEEEQPRLRQLEYRDRHEQKLAGRFGALLQQRIATIALAGTADFAAHDAAYAAAAARLPKNKAAEYQRLVDNHHLFRQAPPALLWDRRAYEPLVARPAEFFPNAPTTLLDMQPKATDLILRQYGPRTSRSGEMSDVLLHLWFANTLGPLEDGPGRLWGGFGSEVGRCPSFGDAWRGGSPLSGAGRVPARCVNEEQWLEVMRAWMDWPFRPAYRQLLSRWSEEGGAADEEDIKSGAQGLGF